MTDTASSFTREPLPERARVPARHPSGVDALPPWYRLAAEAGWRFLVIVAAVFALVYALAYLGVVVLPVIVALLLTTLLLPPKRWLRRRGLPDGLATGAALVGALLLLVRTNPKFSQQLRLRDR